MHRNLKYANIMLVKILQRNKTVYIGKEIFFNRELDHMSINTGKSKVFRVGW